MKHCSKHKFALPFAISPFGTVVCRRFCIVKHKHNWKDVEYVKSYLQSLRSRYQRTEDEWHLITTKQIINFGGGGLLGRYKTFRNAVHAVFPECDFPSQKPQDWGDLDYVRDYLQRLRAHYKRTEQEWHLITSKQIVDFNGHGLLRRYKTFHNVLRIAYPEINSNTQQNQNWQDVEYVREYIRKAKKHYQLAENEWYLSTKQIIDFHGSGLLARYKTLRRALQLTFPELEATQLPSSRVKQNWRDKEYLISYLQKLRAYYQISDDEWHLITTKQIIDFNGSGLLRRFGTFRNALQTAYPEINIEDQNSKLQAKWSDEENIKQFIKSVENRLHFDSPEGWYRVSHILLERLGGSGLRTKTRSLYNILQMCYPGFKWDKKLLNNRKKKSEQFYLRSVLMNMFPDAEVIEDFLHPDLVFDAGRPMEIDLYIPSKNLGIEYQGQHHLEDTPFFGPMEMYRVRDTEKQQKCKEIGLSLVTVPYSWNHTEEYLRHRIELISGIVVTNNK